MEKKCEHCGHVHKNEDGTCACGCQEIHMPQGE